MSARILLVEDEPGLVMTLSDLLGAEAKHKSVLRLINRGITETVLLE